VGLAEVRGGHRRSKASPDGIEWSCLLPTTSSQDLRAWPNATAHPSARRLGSYSRELSVGRNRTAEEAEVTKSKVKREPKSDELEVVLKVEPLEDVVGVSFSIEMPRPRRRSKQVAR
jgi:hypothetical protein